VTATARGDGRGVHAGPKPPVTEVSAFIEAARGTVKQALAATGRG